MENQKNKIVSGANLEGLERLLSPPRTTYAKARYHEAYSF